MDQETREEIIEAGAQAQALLDSPAFISVCNELATSFSQQTFATRPDEGAMRSALYHQHVALQTIIGTLRSRAAAMQDILERDEEEPTE